MIRFAALLFIALAGASCKKHSIPDDVLPQQQMQQALWDYLRADVYVVEFLQADTTVNKGAIAAKHYEEAFRKNKTDAAQFKRSFDFYSNRPELMGPMLDSMMAVYSRETEKKRSPRLKEL